MTYKAYVAGPMRGVPHFGAPAFDDAAKQLRDRYSWHVYNPAEEDRKRHGADIHASATGDVSDLPPGFEIRPTIKAGLEWLCDEADCVVVLPGWDESSGATAEVAVADAIGLPVYALEALLGGAR